MRSLGSIPAVSLLIAGFLITGSLVAEKPLWIAPGGSPVAISADGDSVLSGGKQARFYNASGQEQWAGYGASALALTRDGMYSVIGDTAGVRYIDGSHIALWSNYDLGPVEDISLSPDENFIASVASNCVTIFKRDGNLTWKWCYPGTHSAAISRDGRMTAAGTIDSVVALSYWGDELWRYPAPGVEKVAITSQASDIIAVSGYTILSLDPAGDLTWNYLTDNSIRDLGVSSDGSTIVAGNQAGNLYLFNRTGSLLWKRNLGNWINVIALSSDGGRIAAGGLDRKVHLFNGKGDLLWEYATQSTVNGIAMSSDGSFLVAATDDGNISYFDLRGIQSQNVPRTTPPLPEPQVTTSPPGPGIPVKTAIPPVQQPLHETLFPSYSITAPVQPTTQKTPSGCSICLALGIFLLMARRRS